MVLESHFLENANLQRYFAPVAPPSNKLIRSGEPRTVFISLGPWARSVHGAPMCRGDSKRKSARSAVERGIVLQLYAES